MQQDPLPGAWANNSPSQLNPSILTLVQIVPFEMVIQVASGDLNAIEVTTQFYMNTSNGDDFGYDLTYDVYAVFVDTADQLYNDPTHTATVTNYTTTIEQVSNKYYRINCQFNLTGLNGAKNCDS